MSITADARRETVETHRRHDSDSGSAEVQIALLTRRIEALTEHDRYLELIKKLGLRK